MALRDQVTIIIDRGEGKTHEETVVASVAGATVEVIEDDGMVWVYERSRSGTRGREVKAMRQRVVAIIWKPA